MPGPLAVIDYGVNNLGSVYNAFTRLGRDVTLVERPEQLEGAGAVILPGVGSFDRAKEALESGGFFEVLEGVLRDGTPLLGICLGMQLLCTGSEESRRGAPGIGWIRGDLRRFRGDMKVPHMGWNVVEPKAESPLFRDIPPGSHFYFVHSYFLDPSGDPGSVVATAEYGGVDLAAVVARGSVIGTQFHPEKSGPVGLAFLDNFARAVESGSIREGWL